MSTDSNKERPRGVQRSAEEILAIHDVVVRYGYVIDDRAWDRIDEVFTDDAVVDYRDQGTNPPSGVAPIVGRDEIERYFRDVFTHPYQHMILNHQIEDVSDDEVIVRSKALCPMPGRVIVDLEYRDVVVRTPVGWRVRHKSVKRYNLDPSPWAAEQLAVWKSRGAHVV
jgi:SnoaL-like domain